MTQYYPPYRNSSNNIKVKLDLVNYATKTDINLEVSSIMLVVLRVKLI